MDELARFARLYGLSEEEEQSLRDLPPRYQGRVQADAHRMSYEPDHPRAHGLVVSLIRAYGRAAAEDTSAGGTRAPIAAPTSRAESPPVKRRAAERTVDTGAIRPGDVIVITYGPYGTQLAHVRRVLRTGALQVDRLVGRYGWRQSSASVPAAKVLEVLRPEDPRRQAALATLPPDWHTPNASRRGRAPSDGRHIETHRRSPLEIAGQWPRFEVHAPPGFIFSEIEAHSALCDTVAERDEWLEAAVEPCPDPECDCATWRKGA